MKLPEISKDSPMYRSPEEILSDDVQRGMNNIYHLMHTIDKRLEDIAKDVEANTANIEMLEEAVSLVAYIPTRPINLRYDHTKREIHLQRNLRIKFEGNEAEVLSLMFNKTDGRPKYTKFQCSEIALKLSDKWSGEVKTVKSIFQTVKRIQDKLDKKYRLGHILTVKTKEFYFVK